MNTRKIKQQIQELTLKVERNYSKTNKIIHHQNNTSIKIPPRVKKTSNSIMTRGINAHSRINNLHLNDDSQTSNSDFFEFAQEKDAELTADEKLIYGDREPKHYKKVKLLGK